MPLYLLIVIAGCDSGLEPPQKVPEPTGAIAGTVTYSGEWPPENEFKEFFFVPMNFKPTNISQVLSQFLAGNLNASEQLNINVDSDTFFVGDLPNGAYIYNVIANQYGPERFTDWRALGVYNENDGVIVIEGDTVDITIHVDFDNLPPFPPE